MNVKRLKLQGFRSYDDAEIQLPAGTVGVVGPNGAGKSSLMEAVVFGLFGPDGRSSAPYVTEGEDVMCVELEIDHAGDLYRIRRSSIRDKTSLDYDRLATERGSDVGPLTQGSQKDTQTMIEQTLGLNRATFLHSVFLRQGDQGAFPKADPKARRELLADALGLSLWDRAHDAVAADRRAAERQHAELDGRVSVLAEGLDQRDQLTTDLNAARAQLPGLEERVAGAREAAERAAAMVRRHEQAEVERRELAARVREMETRGAVLHERTEATVAAHATIGENKQLLAGYEVDMVALDELQARLAGIEEQQQAHTSATRLRQEYLDEAARCRAQADGLAVTLASLCARAALIEQDTAATCDRCGQHLHEEARATALASLRTEAAGVDEQISGLQHRADIQTETAGTVNIPVAPDTAATVGLRARVMQLAQTPAKQAAARDRITAAERVIGQAPTAEQIDEARAALINARQHLAATPETTDEQKTNALVAAERAGRNANDLGAQLVALRQHAAVLTDRLAQLDARADQHAEAVAARDRLAVELETLKVLDDAFGPAGVPAWIVEHQAIPQIEQHANQVLDRLGGAVTRVDLRTERENKDGTLRPTLDVVCHTDTGARDFATFSGGEQTRADLALRLGLARLLAGRSSDVRMLCLDEPAGLDAAGMEALVDVLRDMTQAGTVDTVLLASHVPALRDAFDTVISCERENGRSRAVVAC